MKRKRPHYGPLERFVRGELMLGPCDFSALIELEPHDMAPLALPICLQAPVIFKNISRRERNVLMDRWIRMPNLEVQTVLPQLVNELFPRKEDKLLRTSYFEILSNTIDNPYVIENLQEAMVMSDTAEGEGEP